MARTRVRIAELDEGQLAKVRSLEKELGTWVVALDREFQLAELSDEQLRFIHKRLEREAW